MMSFESLDDAFGRLPAGVILPVWDDDEGNDTEGGASPRRPVLLVSLVDRTRGVHP